MIHYPGRELSPTRLKQIKHVLGSCALSTNHVPHMYLELVGHIDFLTAKIEYMNEACATEHIGG